MRIFEGLTEKMPIKNAVVTIGTFDGVHIGHQEILKTLIAEAVKCEGESVLLTFYPHPRMVHGPDYQRDNGCVQGHQGQGRWY